MATCKDCIHYNVCDYVQILGNVMEKECKDFANKVNVLPIIRCANCRHRKKGVFRAVDNLVYWQCENHKIEILLTDFCSYGEKEDKKNA